MKLLDLTLASPAENLACDEALLNRGEAGGDEFLRFWDAREPFVVVGYANTIETEVNVAACKERNVPIFRRCSGGGTVLQGPGCLNYTLVLQIGSHPLLANISATNKFIMETNCRAIQSAIPDCRSATVSVCGHTDLALVATRSSVVAARKFSGNSQRRHKRSLLFHGTFLLDFDLPLIGELLRMPSKQPDYRNERGHNEFLANLNLPANRIKDALRRIWNAAETACDYPKQETRELVLKKYSTRKWNFKL